MLTDFVKKCHDEIIPDCKQMRDSQHKSCFINLIDCNILKLISVKLILSSWPLRRIVINNLSTLLASPDSSGRTSVYRQNSASTEVDIT